MCGSVPRETIISEGRWRAGVFDHEQGANVSRETLQKRALKRDRMTQDKFERILNSQLPTHEKLRRADFIIDNEDEHDTVSQVKEIIGKIHERNSARYWNNRLKL